MDAFYTLIPRRSGLRPTRTIYPDMTPHDEEDDMDSSHVQSESEQSDADLDEIGLESVLSHDLKNLLNSATGYTELVLETDETHHLENVQDIHDRMDRLLENILLLAREVENGDGPQDTDTIALHSAVTDAWSHVVGNNVDAELNVDVGESTIVADPGQLEQLLENLFVNAVTHGGEDVAVRVEVLWGEDSSTPQGFAVGDDGPGVPEADRDRIFERGYTTHGTGTGLGLAIVNAVANSHEWDVSITESSEGGARFEFTSVDFSS